MTRIILLLTVGICVGCGESVSRTDMNASSTGDDGLTLDGVDAPGLPVEPDVATTQDVSIEPDGVTATDTESTCPPGTASPTEDTTTDNHDAQLAVGPPAVLLTINEIPGSMNGSVPWTDQLGQPHPFTLRVNHERFTLDVMPIEGSGPIDWESLSVVCDQPLGAADGGILVAGLPLTTDDFEHVDDGRARRLKATPETPSLPDLTVRCTADVQGPEGSATSEVTFETATLTPELDPFATPDTWLIVLSRDIFRLEATVHTDNTVTLVSEHEPDGDGVLDLDEAFHTIGLFSVENPAAAAVVKAQLLAIVRDWAHTIFLLGEDGEMHAESIPVLVVFEGDPGAPDPATWDGSFSMIALGGDGKPNHQENGIVGMAQLDPNNQAHEDNTVYGRGIYPTGIVRQALGNPLGVLLLESILPHTGTPIGDDPRDAVFLQPGFDPDQCQDSEVVDRYTVLSLALEFVGLAIGSTLGHEIGHSLGLVPPGPPPQGLFAGVAGLSFTDNTLDDSHIDTPGLNVMQTGKSTNWIEALSQDPAFNALNRAYLRRRLVVGQ